MLPWLLCGILALAAAILAWKLFFLCRSLDQLARQTGERLDQDTNNLLFTSTRDRAVQRLAAELNKHLHRLRQARQQYENGDRALKEAITSISHDLRTPLTAIWGYLELLEREELPDSAQRCLSQVDERVQAMRQLTEELFRYSVAVSAGEELHLEPVDLKAALEESAASFYAVLCAQGITPVITMPEERVVRSLDRRALSRVLGNLFQNALKYSAGDLNISLDSQGTIQFSNRTAQIGEVQTARLFDRFFTVETGRSSTGLGLSIAKTLVEQMGGSISAQYDGGRLTVSIEFRQAVL